MIFIQFCLGQSIGHGAKEQTIKMHGKKVVCACAAGKLTLNFTVNRIATKPFFVHLKCYKTLE